MSRIDMNEIAQRVRRERVKDGWLAAGMWTIIAAGAVFSALPIFF